MDLYTPVRQEIAVNRENGLKSTFLLQYDALIRPDFQELFLKLPVTTCPVRANAGCEGYLSESTPTKVPSEP